LATDAQITQEVQPTPRAREPLLAPWWHTAILIIVLLTVSINGTRASQPVVGEHKLAQYIWTMGLEWILVGYIWLGIHKRIRMRDLIGGRWATLEDFFLDIVYAGVFWFAAMLVLGLCAKAMHLDQAGKIESMRKQISFLAPGTNFELAVWFCLSWTAGFCEEIIFRGYLQRQFAALGRSAVIGIILSSIVFGASHGYEGAARMFLIAIFGLMFSLLAWWRKSLRPGMIAHAWHDSLSGAVLRVLK
jgi:membrane protease YdiL (CAAX protease family)